MRRTLFDLRLSTVAEETGKSVNLLKARVHMPAGPIRFTSRHFTFEYVWLALREKFVVQTPGACLFLTRAGVVLSCL